MARISWLDEDTDLPNLEDRIQSLTHFTDALADGRVETHELDAQRERLVAAMKAVEADLDDAQHDKVTRVLLEMTAYNILTVLHELTAERVRATFRAPSGAP